MSSPRRRGSRLIPMYRQYSYYVYMLASDRNGTIYIGVTNNLIRRIEEHKERLHNCSFTNKYNVNKLVYYERTNNIGFALYREKQIKKWNRKWKIRLIETDNYEWNDLYDSLVCWGLDPRLRGDDNIKKHSSSDSLKRSVLEVAN